MMRLPQLGALQQHRISRTQAPREVGILLPFYSGERGGSEKSESLARSEEQKHLQSPCSEPPPPQLPLPMRGELATAHPGNGILGDKVQPLYSTREETEAHRGERTCWRSPRQCED